jgi:hypothetical protein
VIEIGQHFALTIFARLAKGSTAALAVQPVK